ncbi:hypothetical protein KI387_041915, partial [Taxus chinensis]
LQSDYGEGRRPVQDSLHNQMGNLCIQENAIWDVQCWWCYLPKSNGHGVQ